MIYGTNTEPTSETTWTHYRGDDIEEYLLVYLNDGTTPIPENSKIFFAIQNPYTNDILLSYTWDEIEKQNDFIKIPLHGAFTETLNPGFYRWFLRIHDIARDFEYTEAEGFLIIKESAQNLVF